MAGKYPGDEFDLEGRHEGYDHDPLLSIRKSRLEAALREAVDQAFSDGMMFQSKPLELHGGDAKVMKAKAIARALTELEQA